jgi:hypothetical protein
LLIQEPYKRNCSRFYEDLKTIEASLVEEKSKPSYDEYAIFWPDFEKMRFKFEDDYTKKENTFLIKSEIL